MSTTIDKLCQVIVLLEIYFHNLQGFPIEFAQYMNYCRNLRFDENPNYNYLRNLFRSLFHNMHFTYGYTPAYDWLMLGGNHNTAHLL